MPTLGKTELRRQSHARLAQISPATKAVAAENIRTHISRLIHWPQTRIVAAYMNLPSEPDLQPLRWAEQHTVLLPRIEGKHLVFYAVQRNEQLQRGSFGIMEPDPTQCEPANFRAAEMIFVPGLAFTTSGQRLGRGRGYYDRILAVLPPQTLRLGVCFHCQLVKNLPTEPHDHPVHSVLTERGAVRLKG